MSTKTLNPDTQSAIETTIDEVAALEAEARCLATRLEGLRENLRGIMAAEELTAWVAESGHKATLSTCERSSLDRKLLDALYPDAAKQCQRTQAVVTLRVV